MTDNQPQPELTDDDLTNAIQGYLWERDYGRIELYNGIKIITNDYGAIQFDAVFDEAFDIVLHGHDIDSDRIKRIKAMIENQHNTLVDIETAANTDAEIKSQNTADATPHIH